MLVVFLLWLTVFVWRPLWAGSFLAALGLQEMWKERVVEATASRQALIEKNMLLQEQVLSLQQGDRVSAAYRQAYVDLYKTALGAQDETVAEVVLRPPVSPYDYYVINRGLQEGVVENSLVVAGGYYTLGFVSQTSDHAARVDLFSRPGRVFTVSVDGVLYRARGQGGGVVHVELPRFYQNTTENLVVRVPGAGPYLLGWIEDISFYPQDSVVIGMVTLGENIFEQELVRVTNLIYQNEDTLEALLHSDFDEETAY